MWQGTDVILIHRKARAELRQLLTDKPHQLCGIAPAPNDKPSAAKCGTSWWARGQKTTATFVAGLESEFDNEKIKEEALINICKVCFRIALRSSLKYSDLNNRKLESLSRN